MRTLVISLFMGAFCQAGFSQDNETIIFDRPHRWKLSDKTGFPQTTIFRKTPPSNAFSKHGLGTQKALAAGGDHLPQLFAEKISSLNDINAKAPVRRFPVLPRLLPGIDK